MEEEEDSLGGFLHGPSAAELALQKAELESAEMNQIAESTKQTEEIPQEEKQGKVIESLLVSTAEIHEVYY